jgi:aminomethyltransferase
MIVPGWDTAQTFEDPEFERSPFELGLAWNVDLDRPDDFLGKTALQKERATGPRFVMQSFTIDADCELADGAELYADIDGQQTQIGTLPSVSWQYGRNRWIGLASLRVAHADRVGAYVVVAGDRHDCRIMPSPLVSIERRRQVPAPL